MKRIISIIFWLLTVPVIANACGIGGIASGQITATNPIEIIISKPMVTLSTNVSSVTTRVSPFGYFAFEVEPCLTYTLTPSSKGANIFVPTSRTFVGGQGDFPNMDFLLF